VATRSPTGTKSGLPFFGGAVDEGDDVLFWGGVVPGRKRVFQGLLAPLAVCNCQPPFSLMEVMFVILWRVK